MKKKRPIKVMEVGDKQVSRRTWISSAVFILSGIFAFGGWHWLRHHAEEPEEITGGLQQPARDVLNGNEKIVRNLYSPDRLTKTYPASQSAKEVRVNGDIGLSEDIYNSNWRLNVARSDGTTLQISLEELRQLPKTSFTFNFKCIEGWDQISNWGGVRFSDFITYYRLTKEAAMSYAGLMTPDEAYYVGIDMPSILHPQTLLAYEVNGMPLPLEHGQPLRLIIPVKYGIKSLKQIGRIFFSNTRPPDYWAERGYDYYAGL
jgi:DMSO/TMAO reductase YedYZ molybdopterin-dependent catalytic subunit